MITVGTDTITTRPFEPRSPGEREYVLCAWFASLLDVAPPHSRNRHSASWLRLCRRVIRQHVTLDTVTIACLRDSPGAIVGFACTRGDQLLFAYVTRTLRGRGIGTALIGRKPGATNANSASKIQGGRTPPGVCAIPE